MTRGKQARRSQPRTHRVHTINEQWRCVFHDNLTAEADAKIQSDWKEQLGQPAPFGSLRKSFREQHCQTLNPMGSDQCPYPASDCVVAFLMVAQRSLGADDPRVYFRKVALSYAAARADNKPSARGFDQEARSVLQNLTGYAGSSDLAGRESAVVRDRNGEVIPGVAPISDGHLHRRLARPTPIGQMLVYADRGPRQGEGRVEGEGPERPVEDGGDVLVSQRRPSTQP